MNPSPHPSVDVGHTPSFEAAVRAVVESLQPGDLVSYGDVAREAGRPGAARAVGQVMARSDGLAWWRVIHADGRLPAGKEDAAAARLRAEGHRVEGTRVRPEPTGTPTPDFDIHSVPESGTK